MVWRNGRRLPAGRVLMIDRARTCRNSIPRNSPRPMWRSASGNRAPCASSPSVLHRTGEERSERTFATLLPQRGPSAPEVVVVQPAGGHVLGVLLVDLVALVELGQVLRVQLAAHLVDRLRQVVAVRRGELVLEHGHDVVGGEHLLVVLEQDPAL